MPTPTPTHPEDSRQAGLVSTGRLPEAGDVGRVVTEAYELFRGVDDGVVADYIPALAEADPGCFGISVAGVDGAVFSVGDAGLPFSIQSVSKPFVFALVLHAVGPDRARSCSASTAPACRSTP